MSPSRRQSTLLTLFILMSMVINLFGQTLITTAQVDPVAPVSPENGQPDAPTDSALPGETLPVQPDPIVVEPPQQATEFTADFEDGNVSDWLLSEGWVLETAEGNSYLAADGPAATATLSGQLWGDVSVSADMGLEAGSTGNISVRVGNSNYSVVMTSDGQPYLYKGMDLVEGITGTALGLSENAPTFSWYRVNLTANGGRISVSVNGAEQIVHEDSEPLPMGWIVLSTGINNTGTVMFDNVLVEAIRTAEEPTTPEDPDEPIAVVPMPTTNPTAQPLPTMPPIDVPTDAAPTDEVEVEATEVVIEEDIDIVAMPTTDPDIVQYGTPVPFSLAAETQAKFGGALLNVVQAQLSGDSLAAFNLADEYFMPRDAQGRFQVVLWGAGEAVAGVVNTNGGVLTRVETDHVEAFVTLDALVNIAGNAGVLAVTLPERAVPTGESGAILSQGSGDVVAHSLDIVGASSWHQAGIRGAGVNIAVIDVGFNSTGDDTELGCLGSFSVENGPGTESHGIEVAEIICDFAPSSSVWMYRASNAAELTDMINRAAQLNGNSATNGFPRADVILVTMDTGITGTDFADEVNAAVAANIPVIASAGNTGSNGALSFQYVGTPSTLTVNASAGSVLSYGWQGAGHYPTALYLNGMLIDSRPAPTGRSAHQYIIPASCGEACTLSMVINGAGETTFRAQVAGGENNTLATDGVVVPLASGSLTELASLDSVISVGAVCPWQAGNGTTIDRYRILPESSIGDPGQPNNANIKPSLVAPSRVATSLSPALPECDGGFGGTSSAAAHVAGMSALLIANPNMQGINNVSAGRPLALKTYLQTRTIDLHTGDTADGFDNVYGAGLVQLGNPSFAYGTQQSIANAANAVAGSAYYVSSQRIPLTGSPNGSITAPFTHPALAIQQAIEDGVGNVVLLPGEYVTSFEIPNPARADPLTITSYDAVDTANWFDSVFWVNDTYEGISGININGVENVVLDEFTFTGSNPFYEALLPEGETSLSLQIAKISPFDVTNSTNVSIINNTFTNFDAPAIVENSNDVRIANNTFRDFDIATSTGFVNGQEVQIPLFEDTVLNVTDSGLLGVIEIDQNTFRDNNMPQTPGTSSSTIQEPIVGIERSAANIYGNRFINNLSESVIAINQWQEGAEDNEIPEASDLVDAEVVVFSSLFDGNPVAASLVQLYQGERFRFINNTVVNHQLANDQFGSIVGLGHIETVRLNMVNHRWEMHNNLFYNNEISGSLVGNPNFTLGADGCLPIGSTLGDPQIAARNNWFAPSFDGGECGVSIGTAASPENENIYINVWPEDGTGAPLLPPAGATDEEIAASEAAREAFEEFHFFTSFNDPFNPFRLRPTDDEFLDPIPPDARLNPGVDTGDNDVVTAIPGFTLAETDLLGVPRILDRPPDEGAVVDRGAYELGNPEPLEWVFGNGNQRQIVPEDTTVIIDLGELVTGGFEPYRFQFNEVPTVFDTNPLNACGGEPFGFDPATYVFTYCPPPDFYNAGGLTETVPAADITFSYRVFSLLDTADTALGPSTIELIYEPVEETQPLNITADPVTFLIEENEEVRYRLEPFAFFNDSGNIVFSNPDDSVFAQSPDVDYPFTYSGVAFDFAAERVNPQMFDPSYPEDPAALTAEQRAAINATIQNAIIDGEFQLNTVDGFTPEQEELGVIAFTYNVTDADGDIGTRRVSIRITGDIGGTDPGDPGDDGDTGDTGDQGDDDDDAPGDPPGDGPGGGGIDDSIRHIGLHDDASLDFTYNGDWIPYYLDGAINNTLHYALGPNNSFEFRFTGDGFAIHWMGYSGGGNYQIELDANDDGNFVAHNDPSLGLVCTNSPLSTNRTNPTTGGLIFFTYGCRGLDNVAPDELRTIRVTGTSGASSAIVVDALEVREVDLLAGYYQDTDFEFEYSAGWQTFTGSGPLGNTVHYVNSPNSTINFQADGDTVDAVIVYRSTGTLWGTFDVTVGGNTTAVPSGSEGPAPVYWGQPFIIPGVGDGTVNVEISTNSANFVGIEAVELFRARPALPLGVHQLDDSRIRGAGDWVPWYGDAESRTGVVYYNGQPGGGGVVFAVNPSEANRVVVHHPNGEFWGAMQICGATCTDAIQLSDAPARYTSVSLDEIGITGGESAVVAINTTSGYIGLESIEVVNDDNGLTPGYYDQIRDYGIEYSTTVTDGWVHQYFSGPRGGSISFGTNASSTATFNIPADSPGIVIYHALGAGIGDMEICADDGTEQCTVIVDGSQAPISYLGRTALLASELGLDGVNVAEITIRPTADNTERIGLMGLYVIGTAEQTNLPTLGSSYTGPNTNDIRYVDNWVAFSGQQPLNGSLFYSVEPGAAALFKFEGQFLNLYYLGGGASGFFEVCIDVLNCGVYEGGQGAPLNWGESVQIDAGSDGLHTVEISSLDDGFISLEAVEIGEQKAPLGVGFYQETDPGLRYTGLWTPFAGDYEGGSLRYSNITTTALTLTANTGDVGRMVVYHPNESFWGQMEVCFDGACETVAQGDAARDFTVFDVTGGNISISPATGYIGIEAIELLPPLAAYAPGFYYSDDFGLDYTNGWNIFVGSTFKGGQVAWSQSTASIDFNVDATLADSIAVHHPAGAAWGSIRVCGVPDTNCQTINLTTATSRVTSFSTGQLGLTGEAAPVSIQWVSGFGGFEAVEVVSSAGLGLSPGYYEEDAIGLTTTGTWTPFSGAGYSGGGIIYSNGANASVGFVAGGGEEGVTGFIAYYTRYAGGGGVELCYTRQSTGEEICVSDSTANPTTQQQYGIGVYGLPPLTADGTDNEVYTVTLTNQLTGGGQFVLFDSVAVLGQPNGNLLQGNFYDDGDGNITYSPSPLWADGTFAGGGYAEDTLTFADNVGATMQMNFSGNTLVMYQPAFSSASRAVRFCEITGNDSNTSTRCSNYSTNSLLFDYPSSITLYGFGFGDHNVVIENRDTGFLTIDGIRVR